MTPAEELLRKIAKVVIDRETIREIGEIVAQQVDWRELKRKANASGTSAQVYFALKESNLQAIVPPEVWADLRHAYVSNSLRNVLLIREADSLLEKLAGEGVAVIALKGAALLTTVYPSIALRRLSDIDLMVRPEQMELTTRVLSENGFEPHDKGELGEEYATDWVHQNHLADIQKAVSVELHRSLVSERSPFKIDIDAIWQRAVPLKIGTAVALALSTEDQLHHLAAHLFGHHFTPIHQWRNMCDVAAVLQHHEERIDWDYLLRSAREYKTTAALYLALNSLDDSLKRSEVLRAMETLREDIKAAGMLSQIEALSRRLPRYDYDALSLLPSTITQMAEESTVFGKLRVVLANVNSKKRLIAFQGVEGVRSTEHTLSRFLRSVTLLTKYNLNSIRMAYLIGKLSKEIRG